MPETQPLNKIVLEGTMQDSETRAEAARVFSERHTIIVDNASVFGWWVDGGNEAVMEEVITTKRRRSEQAYASSVSAEEFLERVDPDRIHPSLWKLLDPEVFTRHFGAVSFVRAPGRSNLIEDGELPEKAVTQTDDGNIIQNWVPEGKDDVYDLLSQARDLGIHLPLVTSLNYTGEREITDPAQAEAFARRHNIALVMGGVAVRSDCEGSFTIVGLTREPEIPVYRNGNIDISIMQRILTDFKVVLAPDARHSRRPLKPEDHPHLQTAANALMRMKVIEHLGWHRPDLPQLPRSIPASQWRGEERRIRQYHDDPADLRAQGVPYYPDLSSQN